MDKKSKLKKKNSCLNFKNGHYSLSSLDTRRNKPNANIRHELDLSEAFLASSIPSWGPTEGPPDWRADQLTILINLN